MKKLINYAPFTICPAVDYFFVISLYLFTIIVCIFLRFIRFKFFHSCSNDKINDDSKKKIHKFILVMFVIILSSVQLQSEDLTYDEFWSKYRYSFRLLYLNEKDFNSGFLNYSSKNNDNQEFEGEILDRVHLFDRYSSNTYAFSPMKSVYEKIVKEIKMTQNIDKEKYKRDDRIVFVKEEIEEPADGGHIPYFCVLKIPKSFTYPENVDVYDYLEKNPEFIEYKKSLQESLKNLDDYIFKMDERGVIWIYYKNNGTNESTKLEELRKKVEKNPTETNMCFYLNAFPSSFKKFKFVFYGQKNVFDELYDKHEEHLNLIWKLSKKYPKKVLAIWLSIAKDVDGHGYADAIGILQLQIARFGSENTKLFSEALKKKSKRDLLGIIRFIADMENHQQYHDYIKLLENLKEFNFIDLYNMFYKARKERMKCRHD